MISFCYCILPVFISAKRTRLCVKSFKQMLEVLASMYKNASKQSRKVYKLIVDRFFTEPYHEDLPIITMHCRHKKRTQGNRKALIWKLWYLNVKSVIRSVGQSDDRSVGGRGSGVGGRGSVGNRSIDRSILSIYRNGEQDWRWVKASLRCMFFVFTFSNDSC